MYVCFVIVDSVLRPVLLIAPFASSIIAKLTAESPDKYCCLDFGTPLIFRLHQLHEMQTIVTDVRCVCQSVCHECTKWPHTVKLTWDSASLFGVIWCSLCQITLASCYSIFYCSVFINNFCENICKWNSVAIILSLLCISAGHVV